MRVLCGCKKCNRDGIASNARDLGPCALENSKAFPLSRFLFVAVASSSSIQTIHTTQILRRVQTLAKRVLCAKHVLCLMRPFWLMSYLASAPFMW